MATHNLRWSWNLIWIYLNCTSLVGSWKGLVLSELKNIITSCNLSRGAKKMDSTDNIETAASISSEQPMSLETSIAFA